MDACYSEDYQESFFNLCDALQTGEDTFQCASEVIYAFCVDEAVLNQLYPVDCMQITDKSPDGSASFENGVGQIGTPSRKRTFWSGSAASRAK